MHDSAPLKCCSAPQQTASIGGRGWAANLSVRDQTLLPATHFGLLVTIRPTLQRIRRPRTKTTTVDGELVEKCNIWEWNLMDSIYQSKLLKDQQLTWNWQSVQRFRWQREESVGRFSLKHEPRCILLSRKSYLHPFLRAIDRARSLGKLFFSRFPNWHAEKE